MSAAIKVFIGIVLLAIGLGLFVDSANPFIPGLPHTWLDSFIIVVMGVIPIFLILVGLLIVWLEIDEVKMEKELKKEEKKKK